MSTAWRESFCTLVCVLSTTTVGVEASGANPGPQERPNVVFILADDLGWADLGCFGSGYYRTPNIDRMAGQGMLFSEGYSCGPNCQPTRAALMSGQYGPRTGVYTVGSRDRFEWRRRSLEPPENVTELSPAVVTVAEALRGAGYATGMFGKWHLGNGADVHPLSQGFDEAIVSMGRHFDFATSPEVDVPEGAYLADFLTDQAIGFIDRHKGEPFFLYLPHFAVHSPFQGKPDMIERIRSIPPAGGHGDPTYAAMIASLDESVGRVLAAIDEAGLGDRTLVIFSSDNGGVGGYEAAGLRGVKGITDNAPLRSGKGSLHEGGIRVPFLFRWPGTIRPGSRSGEPILSVDLSPTLCDLAGVPGPEGQPIDGVSLLPILTGEADSLGREAIFWHFPGYLGARGDQWRTTPVSVVRSGPMKLMHFLEDGRFELYDLVDDPGESSNLADRRPEEVRRLRSLLEDWQAQVGAPIPGPNRPTDQPPDRDRRE
jgi:arylsulfatase A-like enzyme